MMLTVPGPFENQIGETLILCGTNPMPRFAHPQAGRLWGGGRQTRYRVTGRYSRFLLECRAMASDFLTIRRMNASSLELSDR